MRIVWNAPVGLGKIGVASREVVGYTAPRMRPPFVGHRRYSITHRAVQRLRELVSTHEDDNDESLRDRLDAALGEAEDGGGAIRTLDAMLGEPQTLIPVSAFGETLYAIIKEETVVTVLPKGHGEEILHRGQIMEQRVASGQVQVRVAERERERDRFDGPRRRWQKDPPPVVVEHVGRPAAGPNSSPASDSARVPSSASLPNPPLPSGPLQEELATDSSGEPEPLCTSPAAGSGTSGLVFRLPERPADDSPVASALNDALTNGRRRAAVLAMQETLGAGDRSDTLAPLWRAMAQQGLPQTLTVSDLIEVALHIHAD